MHSRSQDHRQPVPSASAAEFESSGHHPLGFADVRDQTGAAVEQPRGPLGFAPSREHFVTELSFRRARPELPAAAPVDVPLPITLPAGAGDGWRPATAPSMTADDELTADEHVPFYKRDISLRRRKGAAIPVDESMDGPSDSPPDADMARPIGFAWPEDEPNGADLEPQTQLEESDDADVVWADTVADTSENGSLDDDAVAVLERAVDPAPMQAVEADDGIDETIELPESDEAVAAPVAEDAADDDIVSEDIVPEPIAEEPVAVGTDLESSAVEETSAAGSASAEDAAPVGEERDDVTAPTKKERASLGLSRRTAPKAGGRGGRGSRTVVGFKIGASQLAAAVVSPTDGVHQLVELVRTPLEPGIVVDGEVRDVEALKEAVKQFFVEHKLPRKNVRIGLASNRIGVRTFDIAGIDDQERFDNAVRFKAHEVLPVSFSESVLDYRVIDERVTDTGELVRRVLLVVAPRDQVESYLDVCDSAGIKVAGVDLEALALLRTFVEPEPFALRTTSDTATVVVSIGHDATTLLVSGGGACEFTRVFDWGGATLEQAIAQDLDLGIDEARSILHGLSLSGQPTGLDEATHQRALDAVRGRLTPFARELVSSLQFYQAQAESLGIGELVITGGTSGLEGLADALHQMIGVSVRVGDPLARVVPVGAVDGSVMATIGSLAVPIGLAIDDEALRTVNLLPAELRAQGRKKPSLLAVALPVAAVVPIAALTFAFMQASGDVSDLEGERNAIQAEIDALPKPTKPTIDPSIAGEQARRATALAAVLGQRVAWEGVLRDVSRLLPGDVSLTRMAAQVPEPTTVTGATDTSAPATAPSLPTGVQIEGYTYAHANVARLIARLSAVPSLSNVQLQSASREEIGKKKIVRFTVLADLTQPGGA